MMGRQYYQSIISYLDHGFLLNTWVYLIFKEVKEFVKRPTQVRLRKNS